jgi:GT2 family glycosyltransferase
MMHPPITVVIPNFNGAALLQKNIPSVLKAMQAYQGESALIVVDDGSQDASLLVLKEHFPQAKVVVHAQNQGFAEAIHSGVTAAETELLFLLNSDVEVSEQLFAPLVEYFEDANTFSVNPLIYDEQGVVKRHSWNLRQFRAGTLKLVNWRLDKALALRTAGEKLPSAYAHGGSFMVRKSMFNALKGFHPIFKPFYSEDYDLGLRAWRRGWASYFEPSVHIVHQSVGSIRSNVKMNHIKTIRRRNRYILEWMHLSASQLCLGAIPASLIQLLGELLLLDKVNLKGFYLACAKLPEVLQARREIQATQTMRLADVMRVLKRFCG